MKISKEGFCHSSVWHLNSVLVWKPKAEAPSWQRLQGEQAVREGGFGTFGGSFTLNNYAAFWFSLEKGPGRATKLMEFHLLPVARPPFIIPGFVCERWDLIWFLIWSCDVWELRPLISCPGGSVSEILPGMCVCRKLELAKGPFCKNAPKTSPREHRINPIKASFFNSVHFKLTPHEWTEDAAGPGVTFTFPSTEIQWSRTSCCRKLGFWLCDWRTELPWTGSAGIICSQAPGAVLFLRNLLKSLK